jgi:hypothetical protein
MELKDQFLAALRGGESHDRLLALVHRHQGAGGVTPQKAYDLLEQIWLDFGFNDSDEESELRDNLEYVLEKVWYECPAGER